MVAFSSPEGHPRVVHGYFTLKALLHHPWHTIVMWVHGRDGSRIVSVIPHTVDLLDMREVADLVGRIRHPGQSPRFHKWSNYPTVGNLKRNRRTHGILSKTCTISVPDQHSILPSGSTLAFYTRRVVPDGRAAGFSSNSWHKPWVCQKRESSSQVSGRLSVWFGGAMMDHTLDATH